MVFFVELHWCLLVLDDKEMIQSTFVTRNGIQITVHDTMVTTEQVILPPFDSIRSYILFTFSIQMHIILASLTNIHLEA